jgi:primary-amine oxidase
MKTIVALVFLLLATTTLTATHPLEPLSADEHTAAFAAVTAHFGASGVLPKDSLLFPFIALDEPAKSIVRSGTTDFPREATVHVFHWPTNRLWIATVDLKRQKVTHLALQRSGTQPAVTAEEYVVAEEIVRAYGPWAAAMRARGVEPDDVYIDVWAPGDQDLPANGTRVLRALSFLRGASLDDFDLENPQNPYVRPIEGVVVTIDMNRRTVIGMSNTLIRPVSSETGNAETRRGGLKPMRIVQPNGPGFDVDGRLVKWQKWSFYAVLHPREGLVLYDVRFDDRPIAYRLSLSEIYVPYGLADANWSWRTAFDVGEYNLGQFAQALEVNGDVPEHTYFFDAVFGSDTGEPYDLPQTLGMYERDNGILWTRTDPSLAERDTRGRRELVLTWNAWIGNYIYGFDWILGMDGTIEVKVVLTGTLLTRGGVSEAEEQMAPAVSEDVSAPNHQHFFSFRLDLDVDGAGNHVHETDIRHIPTPGFLNAFGPVETAIEREGYRDADPLQSRHWEVHNGKRGYAIETKDVAVPLSSPLYEPLQRAAFASHAFWVTRFREDELYAAGEFPNQGESGEGLTAFATPAEPLTMMSDVVVWPTIGMTHVPRTEDYPVMPTETIGFKLVPHGFFDRNPALDVEKLPVSRPRRRSIR